MYWLHSIVTYEIISCSFLMLFIDNAWVRAVSYSHDGMSIATTSDDK